MSCDFSDFLLLHKKFKKKEEDIQTSVELVCKSCSTPENKVYLDDYEGSSMICNKCDRIHKVSKNVTSFIERSYTSNSRGLKYIPINAHVDKIGSIVKDMEKLVRLNAEKIKGESPIQLNNVFKEAAKMSNIILEVRLCITEDGKAKRVEEAEEPKKKGSNRSNVRRGIYAVCFGIALYTRKIFKTKKELCSYFGIEEKYYSGGKSIMHSALGLKASDDKNESEIDAFLCKYFEMLEIKLKYLVYARQLLDRILITRVNDSQSLTNTLFSCLYSTCMLLELKSEKELFTIIDANKSTKLRNYHRKIVYYKKVEFDKIFKEWEKDEGELNYIVPTARKG